MQEKAGNAYVMFIYDLRFKIRKASSIFSRQSVVADLCVQYSNGSYNSLTVTGLIFNRIFYILTGLILIGLCTV